MAVFVWERLSNTDQVKGHTISAPIHHYLRPESLTVTFHGRGAPTLKFLAPYIAKIFTPDLLPE